MSRGNAKQDIFIDDDDRLRFLDLLGSACDRFAVQCQVYCQMKNHYHALLQAGELPLSRMMQQLNSPYCQRFNRKHGRIGHVLHGRFTGILVDSDIYFLRAARYILRNPVAEGWVADPVEWPWSSYRATVGLEEPPPFLAVGSLWGHFAEIAAASAQVQLAAFMAHAEDDYRPGPLVCGSEAFQRRANALLEAHRDNDDFVHAERFAGRPSLESLLAGAQDSVSRDAAMREAFLKHAYTLREIARAVGSKPATVWRHIHVGGVRSRSSR
jgi:putative transposase